MDVCIEVHHDEEGAHLELSGKLDIRAYDRLVSAVKEVAPARKGLTIHVANLRSIDSAGLGMLLLARELSHAPSVRIRAAADGVLRALHTANFGQLFAIE